MHGTISNHDLFSIDEVIDDALDLLELIDDLAESEDIPPSSYYLNQIIEAYLKDEDTRLVESIIDEAAFRLFDRTEKAGV